MKVRGVPFYPLNHWEKFRVPGATVMARRSYISYRIALSGASYAHVSDEAGTTGRLLRSEYYRKASKEDAERYFSLKPASV